MYQTFWVDRSLLLALMLAGGLCLPAIAETTNQITRSDPASLSEDIPEEILRTEIYTEARSPVDGELLSAAEYLELNESLRQIIDNIPPKFLVSEKLQRLIELLKLRKQLRILIPFI